MATSGISLNWEETVMFIDAWESFPCLWAPWDDGYKKVKTVRVQAKQKIAEMFGRGWTAGKRMFFQISTARRTTTIVLTSTEVETADFIRYTFFD